MRTAAVHQDRFGWKWLAGLAFVVAALTSPTVAHASGPVVAIIDRSSTVTPAELADALPAFQAAVSEDLAPAWGADATLTLISPGHTPPAGVWALTLSDDSDSPGALGYHDVAGGVPYGRVFTRTSAFYDVGWSEVLTHELFEMLVDPYVNRLAVGRKLWLVEVCDPVEDGAYDYSRAGASGAAYAISDFALPAWYKAKAQKIRGGYDFTHHVRQPGKLLPGGFAYYYSGGIWRPARGPRVRTPLMP